MQHDRPRPKAKKCRSAPGAALFALLGGLLVLSIAGAAEEAATDFAFVQKPGAQVPLDARVTTSTDHVVSLQALLNDRPTILALGYFHCPSLCTTVRDDLFEALDRSGLATPADYSLVVMSIDPAETAADAASALAEARERHPNAGTEAGWHFVTGDAATIAAVTQSVGFRSRYDVHLRQFLHPAGIVILTQAGRVSGYVLGVGYQAGDVRSAVTMASSGGFAKAALPILLLCFHFDETTGRYSLAVLKVLRLAGVVTVLAIAGTILVLRRRARTARAV